jgi:uncharacterized protein (TIGR00297 family)
MSIIHFIPVTIILVVGGIVSVKAGKLTITGALTGMAIGALIFAGAGYTGISMLTTFFIGGTLATSWKKSDKLKFKPASDHSLKRNAGQVFANGGVAAIAGTLAFSIPSQALSFRLMMAAALASAMADTWSSELGMVYGRRFYNILTFKKDVKGLDGVISTEGLLIGIFGSVLIAAIYCLAYGWGRSFAFIIIAGTIGNLSDSVFGALLERKNYIGNDMVNFLNTATAALVIWLCFTVTGA